MEISPFPYQGPLEPDQVHGRQALIADLTERVTEHRVTALLGPRRFGKTSVLRRVAADVIHGGAAVVWTDLYEVASMADVAVRLDDALARVPGRFGEVAQKLAASAALNLGVVRFEVKGAASERPDPVATVHGLLDVLVRAAERHPTVAIFDEFSGIARVDGAAGILRTKLQHHYQRLGLVFAGSEPSMMRMLFSEQTQPFYSQADLVEIGPLTRAEVVDLVLDGFAATDRSAGPLPGHIAEFAGGHPQRTMQVADAAWRLVSSGDAATDLTWGEALADVRLATADANERLYSSLQSGEQGVLRVLAGGGAVFGAAAKVLDLPTGTAQHARRKLTDRGHLVVHDDKFTIADPIFADWIKHRF